MDLENGFTRLFLEITKENNKMHRDTRRSGAHAILLRNKAAKLYGEYVHQQNVNIRNYNKQIEKKWYNVLLAAFLPNYIAPGQKPIYHQDFNSKVIVINDISIGKPDVTMIHYGNSFRFTTDNGNDTFFKGGSVGFSTITTTLINGCNDDIIVTFNLDNDYTRINEQEKE